MEHRAISITDYDLIRLNELRHAHQCAARDQPLRETLQAELDRTHICGAEYSAARCGDDEPARAPHRCGDEGGAGLRHQCVSGGSQADAQTEQRVNVTIPDFIVIATEAPLVEHLFGSGMSVSLAHHH